MKKPTKSLNLVGFIFIYIFAGREDGICLLQKTPIKSILRRAFNFGDTSTDTCI